MVKHTPSRFNPDLLARDSTQYSVNIPLRQFSRLQEFLLDDKGEMQATFRFSRRKKEVLVSGRLTTSFHLQCQRCLEPMQWPVDEPFELVFAKTEAQAQAMPDSYDPVVLDETGQIHVVDLFEDEIILHMPTVARHEHIEQCEASGHVLFVDAQSSDEQTAAMPGDTGTGNSISNNSSEQSKQNRLEPDNGDTARKNPFDVLKNLDLH